MTREEDKCNEPLDTYPSARRAFAERQAKLIQQGMPCCSWPLTHWYSDEDFCRAYNQIIRLTDEVERLKKDNEYWYQRIWVRIVKPQKRRG